MFNYFYLFVFALTSSYISIILDILVISYMKFYRFSILLFIASSMNQLNFMFICTYVNRLVVLVLITLFLPSKISCLSSPTSLGMSMLGILRIFVDHTACSYESILILITSFGNLTKTIKAFIYVSAIQTIKFSMEWSHDSDGLFCTSSRVVLSQGNPF